jgi:signal transduction histidine kinase
MKERANLINGSLEIETTPREGTKLTIRVPKD